MTTSRTGSPDPTLDGAVPSPSPQPGTTPGGGRLRRRVSGLLAKMHRVAAAVSAEVVQSMTSFALQIIAVRQLDAAGLGVFALLYSCVVLATAVTTGLIGDSLTVLDRSSVEVRGGLQTVALVTAASGGALAFLLSGATGLLTWDLAVLMGGATVVFVLEELIRRMLMAAMKFWFVVAVDLTCLVVTMLWLFGTKTVTGDLVMRDLLASLLVAQLVGLLVGIVLLPRAERWWARLRGSQWREVVRYGRWRGAQQGVRPAMMAIVRTVVILAVGAALFGQLEAARVYAAPAMLIVNGVGGFLFASYANRRESSLDKLLPLADRGTVMLVLLSLGLGGVAVAVMPIFGPYITNGRFDLSAVAVFGWAVYAACSAVLMPYGQLAAVRGRHAVVMGMRVVEAVVSLTALTLVLVVFDADVSLAPYALALGSLVLGLCVRQLVLVPQIRSERRVAEMLVESGEPALPATAFPPADPATDTAMES